MRDETRRFPDSFRPSNHQNHPGAGPQESSAKRIPGNRTPIPIIMPRLLTSTLLGRPSVWHVTLEGTQRCTVVVLTRLLFHDETTQAPRGLSTPESLIEARPGDHTVPPSPERSPASLASRNYIADPVDKAPCLGCRMAVPTPSWWTLDRPLKMCGG